MKIYQFPIFAIFAPYKKSKVMRRVTFLVLIISSMLLLGGCGKFEDISIHGMKDLKLRGIKDGRILINLTLNIENPNNRKITISKIYLKAWMNKRELGVLKNSEKIVMKPNSREDYVVPVEIVLRTPADIFKLTNISQDIIKELTIEGYIKGKALCISKKVNIEKQPFTKLLNSYKSKMAGKDTLQIIDTLRNKDVLQKDTLNVK
jgi:LEA14-like dessication related protein